MIQENNNTADFDWRNARKKQYEKYCKSSILKNFAEEKLSYDGLNKIQHPVDLLFRDKEKTETWILNLNKIHTENQETAQKIEKNFQSLDSLLGEDFVTVYANCLSIQKENYQKKYLELKINFFSAINNDDVLPFVPPNFKQYFLNNEVSHSLSKEICETFFKEQTTIEEDFIPNFSENIITIFLRSENNEGKKYFFTTDDSFQSVVTIKYFCLSIIQAKELFITFKELLKSLH